MKKQIIFLFLLILALSCSKDDDSTDTTIVNIASNQQATGSSSNDLLSDTTFKSMIIEVVFVEGFEPSQETVNNFVSFLEARTYKPNGIIVEKRAIASSGNSQYSIQNIVDIEEANRTKYNTTNQIAVWAFFADGESSSNSGNSIVLGTAYRNTSFVVFEETIHGLSDSPFEPDRSVLETTVITHEFGHVLGLTNLGADLQSEHEDAEHPKHCDEESCLMYWASETGSGVMDMVSGGTVPQLDAQCIADLQANGGK